MNEVIQKYIGIIIAAVTIVGYVITTTSYIFGLEAKIESLDAKIEKNAKSGSNALKAYKQEQVLMQEVVKARMPMIIKNGVNYNWLRDTCCSEIDIMTVKYFDE